jgi:sugar phosphate isomerase/epimerase
MKNMNPNEKRQTPLPVIGTAFWLLSGGSQMERMEWLVSNGFGGLSLLQNAMDIDQHQRKDLAAAIVGAGLTLTYHGNVHHKLQDSGALDSDFSARMFDDVIWWHENTNGVYSCCSDSINTPRQNGSTAFDFEVNRQHLQAAHDRLAKYGIRVGLENSFGREKRLASVADITQMVHLCSDLDLGLLLDAGHANIHVRSDGQSDENKIDSYVQALPLEILEVHFSDNRGQKDEHKELGYGNLDLSSLFRALQARGFKGQFTLEVCADIATGQYGLDIGDPRQTDILLRSRDRIIEAWSACSA